MSGGPNAKVTGTGFAAPGAALPGPWGPLSGPPTTTTGGIAEAITALQAAIAAGAGSGGTLEVEANTVYNISTLIDVPSNIEIVSNMCGGEAGTSGGPPSRSLPAGYLNYTGTTGNCMRFYNGVAKSWLRGIAVKASPGTSDALVLREGCREVHFEDCYFENPSGPALLNDGNGSPTALTTEDCSVKRITAIGDPAIKIGVSGEGKHCNDCTWEDVTAEGPWNSGTSSFVTGGSGAVLLIVQGGNHQFRNFYCRGQGAQIQVGAGRQTFNGGEMAANLAGVNQLSVSGGEVEYQDLTLTMGTLFVSGGTLKLRRVSAGANTTINIPTSGTLEVDRFCNLTGATITLKANSNAYLPSGGLGIPAVVPTTPPTYGGILLPGATALPTNPPVLGAPPYLNGSTGRLLIVIPVMFPGGLGTVKGDTGPNVALGTSFPAMTMPAGSPAGVTMLYYLVVPAGWYWKMSLVAGGATLGTATAFAEASD